MTMDLIVDASVRPHIVSEMVRSFRILCLIQIYADIGLQGKINTVLLKNSTAFHIMLFSDISLAVVNEFQLETRPSAVLLGKQINCRYHYTAR